MKACYKVTFRNSYDKLTSMFEATYSSAKAAKTAIELDAAFFLNAHRHIIGKKSRQEHGWINPYTEDYYLAKGQDGCECYWQYFKI